MLSWLLGTPAQREIKRYMRDVEKTNCILLTDHKKYIAARRAVHAEAKRREAAWRAAGRPVWRESVDRLTEERVYLDAEDAIKRMGAA